MLNITISTLGLFLDNAVQNGNTQLKGGEGPGKDKPHTITILAQSMGLSGGAGMPGMGGGGGAEAELARLRAENNMLKAKAEL